jgi:hypothetical protein
MRDIDTDIFTVPFGVSGCRASSFLVSLLVVPCCPGCLIKIDMLLGASLSFLGLKPMSHHWTHQNHYQTRADLVSLAAESCLIRQVDEHGRRIGALAVLGILTKLQ